MKCVPEETIKSLEQISRPRYLVSFRTTEKKQLFLDKPLFRS